MFGGWVMVRENLCHSPPCLALQSVRHTHAMQATFTNNVHDNNWHDSQLAPFFVFLNWNPTHKHHIYQSLCSNLHIHYIQTPQVTKSVYGGLDLQLLSYNPFGCKMRRGRLWNMVLLLGLVLHGAPILLLEFRFSFVRPFVRLSPPPTCIVHWQCTMHQSKFRAHRAPTPLVFVLFGNEFELSLAHHNTASSYFFSMYIIVHKHA